MSARYVTLGDGRKIGLGRYVAAWKECLNLPPKTHIGRGIDGWGQTAAEALRALREGLVDRINRRDPAFGRGRKWHPDWQRAMSNAARDLNYRSAGGGRLVIRYLPPEVRERFAHRIERD
jgi:hypothetical protein